MHINNSLELIFAKHAIEILWYSVNKEEPKTTEFNNSMKFRCNFYYFTSM